MHERTLTAHEPGSMDKVGILVHAINNGFISWPVCEVPGHLEV
jgi:hypothetical protein